MNTLRVLHIYRTYFPQSRGGIEEAIRQICLGTANYQVNARVFYLSHHQECHEQLPEAYVSTAPAHLTIASCDIGSWSAIQEARKLASTCDVIQIHYPWPFADLLVPWILKKNQALIVTYHSDIVRQGWLNRLYSPLRNYLLRKATRIIATSPNYAKSSTVLKNYSGKIKVIPLGLDPSPPISEEKLIKWRQQLPPLFFLFIGVMRYYKGLDYLIEAARLSNHPIVLIGEGPEKHRLEAQASDLKHVHFLGALDDEDKLAILQLAHSMVFPSHLRSEAFGVSLLEAARAKKSMITCDIQTGTSWVNQHQTTGLVIPPANPKALAEAMNLLATDLSLNQRYGEQAYERWQAHFQTHQIGEAYRKLYDEALSDVNFDRTHP
jgi:rhamnosyl/mannosyltransferase